MRFEKRIDGNCPNCHGRGDVITSEKVDTHGQYWMTYGDCYCVEYFMDDEMKQRIATIRNVTLDS